jgi:methylphosphotriester-DNA--protein-cysteine methyltransferase
MARDASFDGRFFYSVATTGIYCRPSCPARSPKRGHVRFHDSAREAEAAGFRPCKRCKPGAPPLIEQHTAKVQEACRLIETAAETPSLGEYQLDRLDVEVQQCMERTNTKGRGLHIFILEGCVGAEKLSV